MYVDIVISNVFNLNEQFFFLFLLFFLKFLLLQRIREITLQTTNDYFLTNLIQCFNFGYGVFSIISGECPTMLIKLCFHHNSRGMSNNVNKAVFSA